MSAVARVIDEQAQADALDRVRGAAGVVVRMADEAVLVDAVTERQAEEILQRIASGRRAADRERVAQVRPLNDEVRRVNADFKSAAAPYDQADRVLRDKLIAFRAGQERLRQEAAEAEHQRQLEEQRRLDDERAAAEAKARAEREAAAREAARKAEEARKAEQARREQMEREAGELAKEIAALDDEVLHQLAAGGRDDERAAAAAELRERATARRAKRDADAARQREETARLAEQAAREAPRAVAAPAPLPVVASSPSAVASRKVWKGEVVNATQLPAWALVPNQVAINQRIRDAVKAGLANEQIQTLIPGVEIRQHNELAVRSGS